MSHTDEAGHSFMTSQIRCQLVLVFGERHVVDTPSTKREGMLVEFVPP